MILSRGLLKIGDLAKRYNKHLGIIMIILILSFGSYYQLIFANNLIKSKSNSYLEVKLAGEWIKENSNPGDIVFSASEPQNTYYSERKTYRVSYESPTNISKFEQRIVEFKPKFLVLSVFEYHDPLIYSYPQEHPDILIPVQAYQQNGQPLLVIYQFNYSNMEI